MRAAGLSRERCLATSPELAAAAREPCDRSATSPANRPPGRGSTRSAAAAVIRPFPGRSLDQIANQPDVIRQAAQQEATSSTNRECADRMQIQGPWTGGSSSGRRAHSCSKCTFGRVRCARRGKLLSGGSIVRGLDTCHLQPAGGVSARLLQDVDRAGDHQPGHAERHARFQDHEQLGPPLDRGDVGGAESGGGPEGQ